MYFETSALTGENVTKPFQEMAEIVYKDIENGVINVDLDTAYGVKRGKKNKNKYAARSVTLNEPEKKPEEKKECAC